MSKKLTVVIPGYNEGAQAYNVVRKTRSKNANIIREIIFVDDGSSDDTAEKARQAGARVIRHHVNRGYGAALKTGIKAAKTEYVIVMDSDGQHDPEDVGRLWKKRSGHQAIIGSRARPFHSPFWRMPGKWLLTLLANYLTRQSIPDINSGMRIFHRNTILRYLHLFPSGFSFSTTSTITLIKRGYSVLFVPIQVKRRVGRSTVSIQTGFDTIVLILRIATLFDPLRVFLPISLLFFLAGLGWAIPYTLAGRGVSIGALIAIMTSILLFSIGLISDQVSQLRLEKYE